MNVSFSSGEISTAKFCKTLFNWDSWEWRTRGWEATGTRCEVECGVRTVERRRDRKFAHPSSKGLFRFLPELQTQNWITFRATHKQNFVGWIRVTSHTWRHERGDRSDVTGCASQSRAELSAPSTSVTSQILCRPLLQVWWPLNSNHLRTVQNCYDLQLARLLFSN